MTNTNTCDVEATVAQIEAIVDAGADLVRVSVPTMEAADAFGQIRSKVSVPLVADIHFDHKIALKVIELGVDCLRINPGNIGREERVRAVVSSCRDHGVPIRIGVNAGSLEKDLQKKYGEPTPDALVESAMRHIDILDRLDFQEFKVISPIQRSWFLGPRACRQPISRCPLWLRQDLSFNLQCSVIDPIGFLCGGVRSVVGLLYVAPQCQFVHWHYPVSCQLVLKACVTTGQFCCFYHRTIPIRSMCSFRSLF